MLLVTAALPYALCRMSSVGISAQVFPIPNSQNWGWEEEEKGRERERRKRKRTPCKGGYDWSTKDSNQTMSLQGLPEKGALQPPRHCTVITVLLYTNSEKSAISLKAQTDGSNSLQVTEGYFIVKGLYQVKIEEGERQHVGKECNDTFSLDSSHYNYSDVHF